MIKAVLWDFGGVITTSPFEAFNRFEAENNLPRDFIRSINATNPESNAWAQLESSRIDVSAFDELFAEEVRQKGHEVRGADVLTLLSGDLRSEMVQAFQLIKEQFSIGCITNNVRNSGEGPGMARTTERASAVAEVMALFSVVLGYGVYHRIYGEEIKLIVIVELWIMWVTGKLSTLSTAAFFRFFEKFDFAPEQVVENPLEE
jgi:putative hydrolase of the HAD superfamily